MRFLKCNLKKLKFIISLTDPSWMGLYYSLLPGALRWLQIDSRLKMLGMTESRLVGRARPANRFLLLGVPAEAGGFLEGWLLSDAHAAGFFDQQYFEIP